MHIMCKNESISMWGKHRCRITKEIAIHLTRNVTLSPCFVLVFCVFITYSWVRTNKNKCTLVNSRLSPKIRSLKLKKKKHRTVAFLGSWFMLKQITHQSYYRKSHRQLRHSRKINTERHDNLSRWIGDPVEPATPSPFFCRLSFRFCSPFIR